MLVPSYIAVLSISLDIMVEVLRGKQEETEPAALTLDAALTGLSILGLFHDEAAIDEGCSLNAAAADTIAQVAGG